MTDREELEELARMTVSASIYYDLVDDIEIATDEQLRGLIACGGDEAKEEAYMQKEVVWSEK